MSEVAPCVFFVGIPVFEGDHHGWGIGRNHHPTAQHVAGTQVLSPKMAAGVADRRFYDHPGK